MFSGAPIGPAKLWAFLTERNLDDLLLMMFSLSGTSWVSLPRSFFAEPWALNYFHGFSILLTLTPGVAHWLRKDSRLIEVLASVSLTRLTPPFYLNHFPLLRPDTGRIGVAECWIIGVLELNRSLAL